MIMAATEFRMIIPLVGARLPKYADGSVEALEGHNIEEAVFLAPIVFWTPEDDSAVENGIAGCGIVRRARIVWA